MTAHNLLIKKRKRKRTAHAVWIEKYPFLGGAKITSWIGKWLMHFSEFSLKQDFLRQTDRQIYVNV